MRRLMLAAIFAVALGVGLSAQQWIAGGCSLCFMVSYVDIPGASDVPNVSQSQGFTAAGWGFICEGGAAADRVDIWFQRDDGYWDPYLQPHWSGAFGLHRPDVQAHFQPYCPQVTSHSGWHKTVTYMPAQTGVRQMLIQVWRGPYFETHYRHVNIVP